ncbi:MAG: polysaccharide deacetylase family protein [Gottschalkiaceae bacterium]|nr:MAG: polysaccharide deacetylase family protein [Gottschalkiaceae bacterium]
MVYSGSRNEKNIALTFDDGPHPIYTEEILDILKEYNVKATFFILGKHGEEYPDILHRQNIEGHELGIHSYNHINLKNQEENVIREEFSRTQDIIRKVTGKKSKLFRPPYGIYNQVIYDIVSENGGNMVLWTYYQDTKDWGNPGVEKIIEIVLSQARNGDIILFHDHNEAKENQVIGALKIIIPELLNRGYKFVTISELLK